VLSDEIPNFLYDYINTPAMQRIGKIGCGCGTDYTKIFKNKFFYSNLEQSIGIALIVWNFTKDKKTLEIISKKCYTYFIKTTHI